MVSAANLLTDAHRLHLNDDMIDKLIMLLIRKKLMDRIRNKNVFSITQFENIDSIKRIKVLFVIIFFVLVAYVVICYCSFAISIDLDNATK